jgi:hypothetical protein
MSLPVNSFNVSSSSFNKVLDFLSRENTGFAGRQARNLRIIQAWARATKMKNECFESCLRLSYAVIASRDRHVMWFTGGWWLVESTNINMF